MRLAAILTFLLLGLASATPLQASPTNVRLEIYLASTCPADQGSCPQGKVPNDGTGSGGVLRMKASAQDPLGLRRIRIEGRAKGTTRWYCIAERDARSDGVSSEMWFDWDSSLWPSPEESDEEVRCSHTLPHIHGTPTPNGSFEIRAAAVSLADNQDEGRSPIKSVVLVNRPEVPAWSEDPILSSESRSVGLTWAPNPEPDLVAYQVLRRGPDGTVRRFFDARTPERSGCSRIGSTAIRCSDQIGGKSGTYRYQLIALRPGGNLPCMKRKCIASLASSKVSVTIRAAGNAPPSSSPMQPSESGASVSPPTNATASDPPNIDPTVSPIASQDVISLRSAETERSAVVPIVVVAAVGGAFGLWLLARRRKA